MQIHLIAIGKRMPDWVGTGFEEYARRMPRECRLVLHGLAAAPGSRKGAEVATRRTEGRALLGRVPDGAGIVALDQRGDAWSTASLAQQLGRWLERGRDVALLVGGADGLDGSCRKAAEQIWSLSPLTLPHMLVRVLVAEQLYRAWSLLHGHPYHRE